jgi:two-component system, NarL family, response regulator NreC
VNPIRVVLADDMAIVRSGLRLLVDSQVDMQVVGEAGDGKGAVDQARRARPDVVVLDLTMPDTDAMATIRQLARLGTRTVVLTMHDDPGFVAAALAAGAHGYVVKKAADVDLLAAIRAVSRGCRFLDASSAREQRRLALPVPARRLSGREEQVLRLVAHGFTNREIAAKLGVSVKTVETFRARVCEKVGARTRAELVGYALRVGLVSADETALDAAARVPPRTRPAGRA